MAEVVDALVDVARLRNRRQQETLASLRGLREDLAARRDRATASDERKPVQVPHCIRINEGETVLDRAGACRDLMVDVERVHVRRRDRNQLGAGEPELSGRFGKLDVEEDERADPRPRELDDHELVAALERVLLGAEEL